MLKTFIRHLFILTVVIGLAGQGIARASTPCDAMMKAQAATMAGMSDCDSMHNSGKGKAPCKDMTAGCFAVVGCFTVAAIDAQPIIERSVSVQVVAAWPATTVLIGRDTAPEPVNRPAILTPFGADRLSKLTP